ncbi:MAG: hypothetical protein RRA35_07720, partial [Desulfomonilia bacterium]|nr:hypothetical protein [Desulfomonilia bacterium]
IFKYGKSEVCMADLFKGLCCVIWSVVLLHGCAFDMIRLPAMGAIQIASVLQQGSQALPYLVYSGTDLKTVDDVCKAIHTKITLDDTYKYAYGRDLSDVLEDGKTGQAFRTMQEASRYLQNILKGYGEPKADEYFFASIDTAQKQGYILLAVVHRQKNFIAVKDKFDQNIERTLGPQDLHYYRPYQVDAGGVSLDTIVDWAGLPSDGLSQQGSQAVLMTLAANKIVENETKGGYWEAEDRWINGDFKNVLKEEDEKTYKTCGLQEGFFKE